VNQAASEPEADPVGRLFSPSPPVDSDSSVLAAGAICWRRAATGEMQFLLVHSARWGDWSWPKGKWRRPESLPECAVREVLEETGVRAELGVPLPTVSYVLPDGSPKSVRYWAARVRSEGERTASVNEIADTAWLSAAAATTRLTRPGDLAPLTELLALDELGRLDTWPLLVLRHAKARSRARWPGGEADRPLTGSGRRQARNLAGLLACWDPERLLCSPWSRCMLTVQPYLDRRDRGAAEPEIVPLLSEQGLHNDSSRIGATVTEVLAAGRGTLLCTHRPVLELVVAALAEAGSPDVRDQLPDGDPWLSPAEVLVAHVNRSRRVPAVTARIHSVERYRGESGRRVAR
jgi:8-oxo-dGTP pyrophosphatase MutT (NUDIX family)/phosphohistidine phosphatase SixA